MLYIDFKTYGADHMKENLYASLAEKNLIPGGKLFKSVFQLFSTSLY